MPVLLDILYPWPVVSIIASHLGVGDLLQLARTSSECRAALHGFPRPASSGNLKNGDQRPVRPELFVGLHQTSYWVNLKAHAQMSCAETRHRKGSHSGLCRYCSMPVCDACVVRESFAQSTSAWRTRTRHLCVVCWAEGIPHRNRNFTRPPEIITSYNFSPGHGDFCRCTVHDGWLCSPCRTKQCADVDLQRQYCFGEGCDRSAGLDKERRSICLWCDLPVPGVLSRTERWQGYGQRYTNSPDLVPVPILTYSETERESNDEAQDPPSFAASTVGAEAATVTPDCV